MDDSVINETVIIRNKNLSDSAFIPANKSIIDDSDSEDQHLNDVISTINLNINNVIDDEEEEEVEEYGGGGGGDEEEEEEEQVIITTTQNETDVENQQQSQQKIANSAAVRPCQFSISRVKSIMKLDPELSLTSKESVFLVAKATVSI